MIEEAHKPLSHITLKAMEPTNDANAFATMTYLFAIGFPSGNAHHQPT